MAETGRVLSVGYAKMEQSNKRRNNLMADDDAVTVLRVSMA